MKQVKAKVGTGPQTVIWVLGRVKDAVPQRIKFREGGPEPWRTTQTGILNEVKDMGTYFLWVVERF